MVAVAVVMLAGGALVAIGPAFVDKIDAGSDLRPYEAGKVYKVRVADTITVYADGETRDALGPDTVSGMVLIALATVAAMTYLLLAAAGAPRRQRMFYGFATAGLVYVALDELFALHETIGHNLPFLADLPGIERPDDLVFALYVVPAAIFVYAFWDVLRDSPIAARLFGVSLALFALTGVFDITGLILDEPMEILVGCTMLAGFALLCVTHLAAALGLPKPTAALGPRS